MLTLAVRIVEMTSSAKDPPSAICFKLELNRIEEKKFREGANYANNVAQRTSDI